MDGDATAKTFDSGANSAIRSVDGSDGIHEASNQATPAGQKTTETGTSVFSKDGAIGSQFTASGAIGGMADAVGGPFSKDGVVGNGRRSRKPRWDTGVEVEVEVDSKEKSTAKQLRLIRCTERYA